jgi:hypothetical protein
LSDVTGEIKALERIQQAVESELDKSGWSWNPIFSSILDKLDEKRQELYEVLNAEKLEEREAILEAQRLCLQLLESLEKIAVGRNLKVPGELCSQVPFRNPKLL